MKKLINSKWIGYTPLVILLVSAINLIWVVATTLVGLHWKHMLAMAFLCCTTLGFVFHYRLGILLLGLTLLVGLFTFLSLSPTIVTKYYYLRFGDTELGLTFQPIFLWWSLLHFALSGKYYLGIGTAQYWRTFFEKQSPAS